MAWKPQYNFCKKAFMFISEAVAKLNSEDLIYVEAVQLDVTDENSVSAAIRKQAKSLGKSKIQQYLCPLIYLNHFAKMPLPFSI